MQIEKDALIQVFGVLENWIIFGGYQLGQLLTNRHDLSFQDTVPN